MISVRVNNKKRIFGVLALWGVIFVLLIGRLAFLQIGQAKELQQKALDQWVSSTPVSAKRGKIQDRNGIVLAQSGTADTVEVVASSVKDPEKVARELSETLKLDYDEVYKKVTDKSRSQVTIKRQIDRKSSDYLRSLNLKGVKFAVDTKRYYPMKNFLSQVLGYTKIDGVGQEGLEAKYDKYLAGTSGELVTETDVNGREIPYGAEQYVPAKDGYNVTLTVDAVVQSFLEKAMENALAINNAKSVQGIVMNPKTGDILAMSTKPDFDLNSPPRTDAELLRSLSRNRVITDTYEPGSTFKIVTLSSGLNEGVVDLSSTFDCPGFRVIDGERIKCWKTSHGHQTLAQGVKNSCNPVFMDIATRLGKEKFYDYIYKFGFGQTSNVGLTGDATGIVRHVKYIRNVDIARIGFGQAIAVTPIQLATAASAAINGGNLMQPHIVKEIVSQEGEVIEQIKPTVVRRVITEETSEIVRTLLQGVVRDGSGRNAYIPGYRVGGKTGTAQKYENNHIAQGKLIASFIGFAPADDPQIVVLILVDEPKVNVIFGSTVAAPFVRDVLYDTLKHYNVEPIYDESEKNIRLNVEVPDIRGKSLEEATKALKEAGFKYQEDGIGTVVNQVPQPGAKVPEGTIVLLYMSDQVQDENADENAAMIEVPDVLGKSAADAYEMLADNGLEIKSVGDPKGVAVMQKPNAGEEVAFGSAITVEFELKPK